MLASSEIGQQISEVARVVKATYVQPEVPGGRRKRLLGPPAYPAHVVQETYARLEREAGREPVSEAKLGRELIKWGALRKSVWDPKTKRMIKGWTL